MQALPRCFHEAGPKPWMLITRVLARTQDPQEVQQLAQHIYQQSDPVSLLHRDGSRLAQLVGEGQQQAGRNKSDLQAAFAAAQRAVAGVQEAQRVAVPRSGPLGPRDAYTDAKDRLTEMHKHWAAVKESLAQMAQLQAHATADGIACRRWVEELKKEVGDLCGTITAGMGELKL